MMGRAGEGGMVGVGRSLRALAVMSGIDGCGDNGKGLVVASDAGG
jgi:hypothetical protein